MSGITHEQPRREQAHCASSRCQAVLVQIGQVTFNDLIRAASDAERRAQAAELRCVNYSQEIVDLREDYKNSDDALTLMLKHYHGAEASAKDELARASELAHELEETKRGKDTIIANLLKTNEQLRTHLADVGDRIRKLEREQLQGTKMVMKAKEKRKEAESELERERNRRVEAEERWHRVFGDGENALSALLEATDTSVDTDSDTECDTDCDSDSDWEPACN